MNDFNVSALAVASDMDFTWDDFGKKSFLVPCWWGCPASADVYAGVSIPKMRRPFLDLAILQADEFSSVRVHIRS